MNGLQVRLRPPSQPYTEAECIHGSTAVPLRRLFQATAAQRQRPQRFVELLMFRGLPLRVKNAATGDLEIVTVVFEIELTPPP